MCPDSGTLPYMLKIKYRQQIRKNFLFFLKFCRTHVLFWGHWYPCFGFLVMSPLGFRVGCLIRIAEANVMYVPWDPPLVLHFPTSWQPVRSRCAAGPVPTYCCRGEVVFLHIICSHPVLTSNSACFCTSSALILLRMNSASLATRTMWSRVACDNNLQEKSNLIKKLKTRKPQQSVRFYSCILITALYP